MQKQFHFNRYALIQEHVQIIKCFHQLRQAPHDWLNASTVTRSTIYFLPTTLHFTSFETVRRLQLH